MCACERVQYNNNYSIYKHYFNLLYVSLYQEKIVPGNGDKALFLIIMFKKWDREDLGNYRSITLLSVVGRVFCKILNSRLVQCMRDKML